MSGFTLPEVQPRTREEKAVRSVGAVTGRFGGSEPERALTNQKAFV